MREDVLRWQWYECFDPKDSPPPDGYDYVKLTTLFSAFHWVLESYLQQSDLAQTTVFASTYFSVWEPLLDELTYSHNKTAIECVYLSEQLSLCDLLQVLKDKHLAAEVKSKAVKAILKDWQGRPSFFFNYFLQFFPTTHSNHPLLWRVQEVDRQAWQYLYKLFDPTLEQLKQCSFTSSTTGVTITGQEVTLFLYFSAQICGGNIHCALDKLAQLMSASFVFVHNYKPKANGKCIGVINKPLVKSFLLQRAQEPGAYECCDKFIAQLIDMALGTGHGNAAEYALTNQILTFNKRPLVELLNGWGLKSPAFLNNDVVVRMAVATSINDIPHMDTTDFLKQLMDDRLVLPWDGIMMPNISFFASAPSSWKGKVTGRCLVTVQCKTVKDKLNGKEFYGAIRSTTFRDHGSTFVASGEGKRISFIRVIICTAGWTGSQLSAVAKHNKRHPEQPILLADASARTALFGPRCAEAIG